MNLDQEEKTKLQRNMKSKIEKMAKNADYYTKMEAAELTDYINQSLLHVAKLG